MQFTCSPAPLHGCMQFTWSKPLIMNALLQLNYSVQFSDMDTVWVKPALRAMAMVGLGLNDADMVGMNDGNAGELQLGMFV